MTEESGEVSSSPPPKKKLKGRWQVSVVLDPSLCLPPQSSILCRITEHFFSPFLSFCLAVIIYNFRNIFQTSVRVAAVVAPALLYIAFPAFSVSSKSIDVITPVPAKKVKKSKNKDQSVILGYLYARHNSGKQVHYGAPNYIQSLTCFNMFVLHARIFFYLFRGEVKPSLNFITLPLHHL